MEWIVITSPDFLPGEAFFIDKLFGCGLDFLHFRKPGAPIEACRNLLNEIPKRWHNRIVTHEHFALASEFGLHGVHLNRRNPIAPDGYTGSISANNIPLLKEWHFGGAAFLGDVWSRMNHPDVDEYLKTLRLLNQ